MPVAGAQLLRADVDAQLHFRARVALRTSVALRGGPKLARSGRGHETARVCRSDCTMN